MPIEWSIYPKTGQIIPAKSVRDKFTYDRAKTKNPATCRASIK